MERQKEARDVNFHEDENHDNTAYHSGSSNRVPEYIYLYFLAEGGDDGFTRHEYLIRRRNTSAITQAEVKELVDSAIAGTLQGAIIPPENTWHHFSYIIFAINSAAYVLQKGNAVRFRYKLFDWIPRDNHNFSDGTDIVDPTNVDISGAWFINQRRRRGGGVLQQGDREKFAIDYPGLGHTFPLAAFFDHGSSGTNVGP